MTYSLTQKFYAIIALVPAAAMLIWAGGCTDSFAPREAYEDPYAVYGLLTPDRDTQSVWVFPIEEFPTLGTPDALEGVTVTSTDLETGEVHLWQDSLVVRANGQHEFLYRAPFRAAFDRRYRVEVRDGSDGSDEAATWAEVRIPPAVTVRVVDSSRDTVTVEVIGDEISALKTEVEYYVRVLLYPDTSYFRQYWHVQERISGGWRVKIRFNIDRYWVSADYVARRNIFWGLCRTLLLGELRLHTIVGDTAWAPPGPAFDPYILSQQGTMQNVENGTGFIGGGFRIDALLEIPQETVEAACWYYCSSPWECVVD